MCTSLQFSIRIAFLNILKPIPIPFPSQFLSIYVHHWARSPTITDIRVLYLQWHPSRSVRYKNTVFRNFPQLSLLQNQIPIALHSFLCRSIISYVRVYIFHDCPATNWEKKSVTFAAVGIKCLTDVMNLKISLCSKCSMAYTYTTNFRTCWYPLFLNRKGQKTIPTLQDRFNEQF